MAKETAISMNEAITLGAKEELGMGEVLGKKLVSIQAPFRKWSLLSSGYEWGIPITVHVAIGTDVIHQHPSADGAAIGKTTFTDFRLFTSLVTELGEGGVILNLGSAVILPEVFLKALTIARNLGHPVRNFSSANLDQIQHYRPNENVVRRPTQEGGRGYSLTGHHEIMIPLLAAAVKSRI